MKNHVCIRIGTCLVVFVISICSFGYSGGDGTSATPYQIADANDLLELAADTGNYDKYFILTADIDLTGQSFTTAVIAPDVSSADYFQGPAFNGIFNGNGHVIQNLVIEPNESSDYIGLFGYAGYYPNSAEIINLGVENILITGDGGHKSVGALVGEMYYGQIKRCFAAGSVALGSNCENIGGIMGYTTAGEISNSYSKCSITCGENGSKIAGLLGGGYSVDLEKNYSAGLVSAGAGSTNVGGFLGTSDFTVASANFWDMDASGQNVGIVSEGLHTLEMFSKAPFLEAGWDFVGETANGTNDYWKSPIRSYPMLGWQSYIIGMSDLEGLVSNWLTDSTVPNVIYPVDFYEDGRIDIKDFRMLSASWLSDQMLYGFGQIFDGFETGDFSALDWSSEGNILWEVTSSDAYEGTCCAAALAVPLGQASQLNLDIESSEGKIGFYYKLSGGTIYMYIDENIVGMLGQTAGWQYVEYDITEGTHTCNWLFYLFSGPSQADALIDNIRIFGSD